MGRVDTERLGDMYGLINNKTQFEELREDSRRATSFLKTTIERYERQVNFGE